MVCRECGSEDVLADAFAEWNVEKQEWEINNIFDKGAYCNSCDEESRIEEVPLMESPDESSSQGT
jgi:hypothetical protein